MSFLFNGCSSLKQIEFVSFETSKDTNITAMFQDYNELEFLDLSGFVPEKSLKWIIRFIDVIN